MHLATGFILASAALKKYDLYTSTIMKFPPFETMQMTFTAAAGTNSHITLFHIGIQIWYDHAVWYGKLFKTQHGSGKSGVASWQLLSSFFFLLPYCI